MTREEPLKVTITYEELIEALEDKESLYKFIDDLIVRMLREAKIRGYYG